MIVIGKLYRLVRGHLRRISWGVVATALALHMGLTWLLLSWAGEAKLVAADAFVYYYMTTASTIGYGDLSPGSPAGRYVVALFVMPGAIALFASVLAKTSASLLHFWKRHQMGKMSYHDLQGHTVLIGWHGRESERLVRLLLADSHTDDEGIVLLSEGLAENPLPDQIRFVAVDSYADCAEYERAALAGAARVIVHAADDDRSLAAVFAVMSHRPAAHVVAHFDGAAAAALVRSHYPHIECTRPLHVDVIARAAQDAGSSLVAGEWLGAGGPTQFSLQVPADAAPVQAGKLAGAFRAQSALWVGYRDGRSAAPVLNPPDHVEIAPGTLLYYLADARIDGRRVPWAALAPG